MSALTAPETVQIQVGAVSVSGPGSKGYYRLTWLNPDGSEGDTTGGRDLNGAVAKAEGIDGWVSSAAGPKAFATLEAMVEDYLAQGRSPYKDKNPWKPQNKTQIERHLARQLRGFETYRGMDVTRELVDKMRAQAGTKGMVRENTSILRAFLLWGYQAGYLTALQSELLPRGCAMPAPSIRRVVVRVSDDDAEVRARMNGQEETYIRDEDAPSRGLVSALRTTLATFYPAWGELAPELAANSGARWGEQFQLTAHDVHLRGCAQFSPAHIHVDWQVDASGRSKNRRVLPKGNKTRVIPVPALSFTGYPLRQAVEARREAALAEQAAGTNPQALMFPAAQGGMLWYTSFNGDALLPAMIEAGWPVAVYVETHDEWDPDTQSYVEVVTERRKATYPWHSLRHRWARICVDIKKMREGALMAVGGWENIGTVQSRYYRSGHDNMVEGLEYFD